MLLRGTLKPFRCSILSRRLFLGVTFNYFLDTFFLPLFLIYRFLPPSSSTPIVFHISTPSISCLFYFLQPKFLVTWGLWGWAFHVSIELHRVSSRSTSLLSLQEFSFQFLYPPVVFSLHQYLPIHL